ncbi:hypothetical protein F4813DRAFT_386178 [Daldinia decipiens]|uniref:uncharacterized protein n=1 Tax=Daldinia decipiens TaxID=326647 RepID=UPI0020C540E1|nr:uncharacterized protein F4813DRAFT_386178 [Daldinia decipiens]KAI1660766.1 hypothetical protein F4813DRAFT_386178 [Daldinia decipiens]
MESWVGLKRSTNIPDKSNCVVHITNLPVTIDYGTLFSALRGTGKICRATIAGSEAFVQFWSLDGVTRLLEKRRHGLFIIGTQIPNVNISSTGGERARKTTLHSRVLVINGPSEIVNYEYLRKYFSDRFKYSIESVEITDVQRDRQTMRWSFASFNTQSRKAWTLLGEEKKKAYETGDTNSPWKDVWFSYESDPCQPYQAIVPLPRRAPPPPIHPLPHVGQLYHESHPPLPSSVSWGHDSGMCNEDEEENKSKSIDWSLDQNVSSTSSNGDSDQPYRTATHTTSLPSQTPPCTRELFHSRRHSC